MRKLYYSPGACSLAPHIVLEEIGDPYEIELISAVDGKMTDTPEWRKVNPKGRVPALTGVPGRIGARDEILTEAAAILFFLAKSNPQAKLLPDDLSAQTRCLEWMNWLSSAVHGGSYGQLWRPHRFVENADLFPSVIEKGMSNVKEQYAYIENLLGDGRDWAVPGGYTIVDPYLLVFYFWGRRIKLDMRALYPAWTALTDRILTRPAVRRALEAEEMLVA